MGVKGLWQILQPAGRPVGHDTLSTKVLAIDVSIWLNQHMKAMRDAEGNLIRNAHLIGLFRRLCKLLFFGIKPVFVYDGGVPALKKKTLAQRRMKKDRAEDSLKRTAQQLLNNIMKRHVLLASHEDLSGIENAASKSTSSSPNRPGSANLEQKTLSPVKVNKRGSESPLPASKAVAVSSKNSSSPSKYSSNPAVVESSPNSSSKSKASISKDSWKVSDYPVDSIRDSKMRYIAQLRSIDTESIEFKSLPTDLQHEIILEIREKQKYRAWSLSDQAQSRSASADSFSEYQIGGILKKNILSQKLEDLRNEMLNRSLTADASIKTRRIAAEEGAEYFFRADTSDGDETGSGMKADIPTVIRSLLEHRAKRLKNTTSAADVISERGEDGISARDQAKAAVERLASLSATMNQTASYADVINSNADAESSNSLFSTARDSELAAQLALYNDEEEEGFVQAIDSNDEDEAFFISDEEEESEIVEAGKPIASKGNIVENDGANASLKSSTLDGDDDEFVTIAQVEDSDVEEKEMDSSEEASLQTAIKLSLSEYSDSFRSETREKFNLLSASSKNMQSVENDNAENDELFTEDIFEPVANIVSTSQPEEMPVSFQEVLMKDNRNDTAGPSPPIKNIDLGNRTDRNLTILHLPQNLATDFSSSKFSPKSEVYEELQPFKTTHQVRNLTSTFLESNENEDSCNAQESKVANANEDEKEDDEDEFQHDSPITLPTVINASKNSGERVNDTEIPVIIPEEIINEDSEDEQDSGGDESEVEVISADEIDMFFPPVISSSNRAGEITPIPKPVANNLSNTELSTNGFAPTFAGHTSAQASTHSLSTINPQAYEAVARNFVKENAKLNNESDVLRKEMRKSERDLSSVSSEMIAETQELLRLFGMPYITSPMEAEAQCAALDMSGAVDGTITEDSDIFLFGAKRVYKNFFNPAKYAEFYESKEINSYLAIDRNKMIDLAMILGSDYTDGIARIGSVTAIEIIAEFKDMGAFAEFVNSLNNPLSAIAPEKQPTALKRKLAKLNLKEPIALPTNFPDERIREAYMNPSVESSTQNQFEWKVPEISVLQEYCERKFQWPLAKSNELLNPMFQRISERQLKQSSILSYFPGYLSTTRRKIKSKRLQKAVVGMLGLEDASNTAASSSSSLSSSIALNVSGSSTASNDSFKM